MNWFRRQIKEIQRRWRRRIERNRYRAKLPPQIANRGSSWWQSFVNLFRWQTYVGIFKHFNFASPVRYWKSRSWRRLLIAIPAVLALVGLIFVSVAVGRQNHRDVAQWYADRATEEARANNTKAALSYMDAAVQMNPDRTDFQMHLALLALDTGDTTRSMTILNALAPLGGNSDQRGFPAAHLQLAKMILRQPLTAESVKVVEKHLQRIVNVEGSIGIAASELLGDYYMTLMRRPDLAIPHLRRAPAQSPARLQLAQAALQAGDFRMAEWEAKGCIEGFESKLDADPKDVQTRLRLAQCRMILREHALAIATVEAGMDSSQSDDAMQILRRARSAYYIIWLEALERDSKDDTTLRFAVLERALASAPDDGRLLSKLNTFVDPKSKEGERARAILKEQLTDGRNIGLAHFVLGCFAWSENDLNVARSHFEQAHKFMKQEGNVTNNLAWVLANSEPPEYERALALIDSAVEQAPNTLEFRHTRGYILVKMKRWKDAIGDLELALQGGNSPDQRRLHELLAEAYEKIGDKQMTLAHKAKCVTPKKESAEKK